MPETIHTFEDVYLHVTDLLLDRYTLGATELFHIEENLFADIDIDATGHIQVNLYESRDAFDEGESLDGGGCCMLWDDDNEDFTCPEDDPEYIDNIRKNGTPEQLAQCIQDKALFVWQLIHSL